MKQMKLDQDRVYDLFKKKQNHLKEELKLLGLLEKSGFGYCFMFILVFFCTYKKSEKLSGMHGLLLHSLNKKADKHLFLLCAVTVNELRE
jgi:hypothetical protein